MYEKGSKKGTARFSIPAERGDKAAFLAGDFTDWKLTPMRRQKNVFSVTVPLSPGTYQYKFIVDSQWMVDPENSTWSVSPIGTMNSVAVLA